VGRRGSRSGRRWQGRALAGRGVLRTVGRGLARSLAAANITEWQQADRRANGSRRKCREKRLAPPRATTIAAAVAVCGARRDRRSRARDRPLTPRRPPRWGVCVAGSRRGAILRASERRPRVCGACHGAPPRLESRDSDEAHLPAEETQARKDPWVQGAHEHARRAPDAQAAPAQGPPPPVCVTVWR
jgi:hypothetical protein